MNKKRILLSLLIVFMLPFALACAARSAAADSDDAPDIVPFDEAAFIDELCAHARAYDSQFILNFAPSPTLSSEVENAINKAQATRYDCAFNVDSIVWNTIEHDKYVYSNFKLIYSAKAGPRPETKHMTELDWAEILNHMLLHDLTDYTVCIPAQECSQDELLAMLSQLSSGVDQALFSYKVEEDQLSIASYEDYLVPTLTLFYREDALPSASIFRADSPYESAQYLMDKLSDGEELLTLYVSDMAKEELQLLLWDAQINDSADMVEEAVAGSGNYYEAPDGSYIAELSIQYSSTQAERETRRLELKKALREIEEEIRADMPQTDEELYRAIALAICERASYDEAMSQASLDETLTPEMRFLRTAYGALCDGRSVCTSYSAAFKALCDRFSLPCWVIMGEFDGAGHAWNAVLLNGDLRYADITFFDTTARAQHLLFSQTRYEEQPYRMETGYVLPPWCAQ